MMLFVSIFCGALAIFLPSCSSSHTVRYEARQPEDMLVVEYSIICVIHGDSDYTYHDTSGHEFKADEEALVKAKRVAQQNPHAEVFIFHQRPKRHFLFFFPIHDGEFFYYRNGRLIANDLYWRDQEQSRFDPELDLYRRFRADIQSKAVSLFLYYGHEIPEIGVTGYDASYPDRTFTIQDLAGGLKEFTRDSTRFDLTVLSTCFNGTPYTIGAIGPYTRTIIASPDNLHLSYFDLRLFERLNLSLQDGDVPAFAKRFALRAFDRLTGSIQTAVSVAVYDVDSVQNYIRSVQKVYDDTRTALKMETQASMSMIEHCDCADFPAFVLPTMNKGVDVYYRPARFGRSKNKQNHSGWECWSDRRPQSAASQTVEPVF